MFCPLCESETPDSSVRCRACGAKLGAREAATQNDSPDALPVGSVLGQLYHIEGVLGQGGFGITYRCRDEMLERAVAVKEFFPSGSRRAGAQVEPGRGFSPDEFREARGQFLLEARLLARCHHPGVVMVHTAFEDNGTAYMVMELLHGQNLMQAMDTRAGAWREEEALAPVERVGAALQYVHDQGLLHRDIKPENIVLCDDGRVMLLDFGTAREYVQGQSQGHTVTVTPGYAPLEQYAKQAKRGAFTDVYGLAATLYYLLTGAPPPAASDRAMGVLVRPVREQNPRVSPAVASAVEAGLHMEIARRPQSVRAFLGLLRAPASQTPTLVVPPLTIAESVTSAPKEIGDYFAPQGFPTATTPAPFAPVALRPRDPDAPKPSLLRPPSSSLPSPSIPATSYKPNWSSSKVSNQMPPNSGGGIGVQDPDERSGVAFGLLIGIPLLVFTAFIFSQSSSPPSPTVYTVSSPGYVAASGGYVPPSSSSSSLSPSVAPTAAAVQILPGISPSSVQKLPVSAPESGEVKHGSLTANGSFAEFSPDGKWAAYSDAQNVVRVWDVSKRRLWRSLPQTKYPIWRMSFSPDGEFLALEQNGLAAQTEANRISVWNLAQNKMLGTLTTGATGQSIAVTALSSHEVLVFQSLMLPSGTSSSPPPRSLFRWNLRTGQKSATHFQVTDALNYLVLSPDGREFVAGDHTGQVHWVNARTGAQVANQSIPSDPTITLRFSSNGSFLASRGSNGIHVFDRKRRESGTLNVSYSDNFALSNDGRSVVATGPTNGTNLWDVRQKQPVRLLTPQASNSSVGALSFSPDGKQVQGVVSSPAGVSLYTWPVNGQNQSASPVVAPPAADKSLGAYSHTGTASFATNPNAMLAVSDNLVASSDGNYAEIRSTTGTFIQQFDMSSGTGTMPRNPISASEFALSPDGEVLATRDSTGKTQLWRVASKKSPISFTALPPSRSNEDSQNQNKNIVFSPANRLAALVGTAGKSEFVELWDLQKSPRRLALVEQDAPVSALAFSRDGRTLLVGHENGSLQWINVQTRQVVARSVGGAPQDHVLAILGLDKEVLVVKRTGLILGLIRYDGAKSSPRGPDTVISSTRGHFSQSLIGDVAAFSPDGRVLAVTMSGGYGYKIGGGNAIGLWDVATGSFLRALPTGESGGNDWLHTTSLRFSPDSNRISCLIPDSRTSQTQVLTWQRAPQDGPRF